MGKREYTHTNLGNVYIRVLASSFNTQSDAKRRDTRTGNHPHSNKKVRPSKKGDLKTGITKGERKSPAVLYAQAPHTYTILYAQAPHTYTIMHTFT